MQFYFIWFREGNCYFGGSAAPNGRRSDVLAWLFLPLCRLPPPPTPLLIFPSPRPPSVLRYILTPARIIAPRVEKSGSITCERRWRIVGSPLFRRQRPRGTINPASSCHLALEMRLIARTIDLDRPIYLALHSSYVTLSVELAMIAKLWQGMFKFSSDWIVFHILFIIVLINLIGTI